MIEADKLRELIEEASATFDVMTADRHDAGSEKYGPLKFLEANTVEEAMFELADLANYARYTFIKLYILNQTLDDKLADAEVEISLGPGAIKKGL